MKRFSFTGRPVLVVLFLAGLASAAFSQTPSRRFSISGTVHDPSDAVISGAQVELRSGSKAVRSTRTKETGGFSFESVPPGMYQVQVSYVGFEGAEGRVEVKDRTPGPVRIILSIAGLHQESTVTAGGSQISTETSENQNSSTVSGDALSNLPVFDQDYIGTMSRFLDSGAV